MEDIKSIIQAKAVDVSYIKTNWGVDVNPEDVHALSLDNKYSNIGGLGYDAHINKVANIELKNHCVLIERYIRPTKNYPNGRLTIVAGGKLLFDNEFVEHRDLIDSLYKGFPVGYIILWKNPNSK